MRLHHRVAHRWFLRIAMSLPEAKAILGFPPTQDPTPAEILKAWRQKAFENHPDRGGDLQKMVEINVAKEVLEGKQRPTYGPSSSPSSTPSTYSPPESTYTPWEPPPDRVTSFNDAKHQAGVPAGVQWVFITDSQAVKGHNYSSDEFESSDYYLVAYGRTDGKHVFLGMRHYIHADLFAGGRGRQDQWTMHSFEYPIVADEGNNPTWLTGKVSQALREMGFEGRFNSRVHDARDWDFTSRIPYKGKTTLKSFLAEIGVIPAEDTSKKKLTVEVVIQGDLTTKRIALVVNGKTYDLSQSDSDLLFEKRVIKSVFGVYYSVGDRKMITRSPKGKFIIEWMLANLRDLPGDLQAALRTYRQR